MQSRSLISRCFSSLRLPSVSHTPKPFSGNAEEILSKRTKHFTNIYQPYFKTPLIITEGHMQYLWDHQGNRYIDLQSNDGQVNIGHNHPALTKIIQDQSGRIIHTSTIHMSQSQGQLSKMIVEQLEAGFQQVYLCNSTGQAIDFALMLTRVVKDQQRIYSYRNGYHGVVGNARAVTSLGSWSSGYVDKIQVEKLNWPSASADSKSSLKQTNEIIATTSGGAPGILVYEPLQTRAGVHLPPQGYLEGVVGSFKKQNGLTICDETYTGVGRVGKEGWGFKWQNHQPDIAIIGANLGNGHPFAAVVTRKEISAGIKHAWFNTFAAGHMQNKIGIEVLKTVKREGLRDNAQKVGAFLLQELKKVSEKSKFIGQVRGKGLLLGIDVVSDKHTHEPSKDHAIKLLELGRERNLLFGRGGAHGNVLLVRPPLCLTLEDAKYIVQAFEDALNSLRQ